MAIDDVAQAEDLFDPLGLDVGEDDFQGFQVPVDIADQGATHRGTSEPKSRGGGSTPGEWACTTATLLINLIRGRLGGQVQARS